MAERAPPENASAPSERHGQTGPGSLMHTQTIRTFTILLLAVLAGLGRPLPGQAQSADVSTAVPERAAPPTTFEQPDLVQRYQRSITPEDLAAQLYFFASDFFEGRETATRGQQLAAHYLASRYRKLGLAPKGTQSVQHPYAPEAYLQPFTVYGQHLAEAHLTVEVDSRTVARTSFASGAWDGDAYLSFGSRDTSSGRVVFAGYGISDSTLGYDDYRALREQDVDPTGRWLLLLRDEPMATDSTSLLPTEDGSPSHWSGALYDKIRTAFRAGPPAGILVVGDVGPRAVDVAERAALQAEHRDAGRLSLQERDDGRSVPPLYVVSSSLANRILAPSGRTVEALRQQIDSSLAPVVFDVPGVTIESHLEQETYAVDTENVLAYLEGSDPVLKDEVLVLSSHYDHIGVDPFAEGDQINNGADDDGSGTVAMLEIAEAFLQAARDGYRPRRSLLFLHVSGEEKGLLGSEYYADVEPVFPLEQTVTNLNIDMIGRQNARHEEDDAPYVYIIGSKLISEELHTINVRANEVTGLDVTLDERYNSRDDPNRFYARSDHWNFGKHGVPFIFFFTGVHDDYHQPGDEAHKIDYDSLAQITRLIFATAWQVANQDAPPAVSGTGFN